jgi:hypothetical protein
MNDLLQVLLSWAVVISGYPAPAQQPEVVRVPHAFMVEHACNARECRVLGWYAGGRAIYIDERLDPQNDLFHSSIVVHEMVHYLQHEAGVLTKVSDCKQALLFEREAYSVQSMYLTRYGMYRPVGAASVSATCQDTPPPLQGAAAAQ